MLKTNKKGWFVVKNFISHLKAALKNTYKQIRYDAFNLTATILAVLFVVFGLLSRLYSPLAGLSLLLLSCVLAMIGYKNHKKHSKAKLRYKVAVQKEALTTAQARIIKLELVRLRLWSISLFAIAFFMIFLVLSNLQSMGINI